jgi:hypothetical protein
MAILNNSNAISTSAPYDINNSLRFRRSVSAHLSRTSSFSGTTNTISFWIKRGELGTRQVIFGWSDNSSNALYFQFDTSNRLELYNLTSGSTNLNLITTQVFRDPSAWYHFVVVINTTQATASNRAQIYVNGSLITAFDTATYPAQNTSLQLGNSRLWNIGREGNTGNNPGDYYLAEWNFIEGQALTAASFGETSTTTGSWVPKAYTGTYGTNGFELNFSDIALTSGSNAGLGKDFSGNGNYWNTNNISVTAGSTYDAMIDSPTLTSATVANYANFNGSNLGTFANATITEAGLRVSVSAGGTPDGGKAYAPFGMSDGSGKWYFEMTCVDPGASNQRLCFGVANVTTNPNAVTITNGYYASASGAHGNFNIGTFTTGDILQVAYDSGTNKLWFGKNNTWYNSGDPVAGTTPTATVTSGVTYVPFSTYASSGGGPGIGAWNFGQRPLSYTPPTGYNRLNTFNLPNSAVLQGNKVMDSTLYTGTGSSLSVTNAGAFKPDLVWVKGRSGATDHAWYDSVRGVQKQLESNTTTAETTETTGLTAFGTSGFTVGALAQMNTSAATYVAWQWQAGQGSTSSNTSGSITSTVSVNATAGFSVVTYSANAVNATVGHGLGVAPKMVIVKARNDSGRSWATWHTSIPNTQYLLLNSTAGAATDATFWNSTSPTSTVFSIGTNVDTNRSGNTYVAYCWAAIPGYSAFGSYVANASSDGPFIFTGFRPEWIMFKRTTSATNWYVINTAISPYNSSTTGLYPNTTDAVSTEGAVDIYSNGFKCRVSSGAFNFPSGETFIYVAFAENPFKNANAR